MHALRTASFWLYEVASRFEAIAVAIEEVPILGEYLSRPFFWIVYYVNEVAYYLELADDWISNLDFDLVIDNIERWLMVYMGASTWDFLIFGDNLFAFVLHLMGLPEYEAIMASADLSDYLRWKISMEWGFLEPIFDDPFGWIVDQITERVPQLGYLFEEPEGWVLYMLGVPWWERIFWSDHLLAWLLSRWGMDIAEAIIFETNPAFWVVMQVEERWPFLDDLILDPIGWFWEQLKTAIDEQVDLNLEWLIMTCGRVISMIWETRT